MKNVVEELVGALYAELLQTVADAHHCPVCREDVMVYALNRLHAHYVATLKGEVVSRFEVERDQSRADATVALMEGFRFVAANPRCGRKPVVAG